MLSDDDLNLADMTAEELDEAWDLWFDLAQSTNVSDPPYTHGVFVGAGGPPGPAGPTGPSGGGERPIQEAGARRSHA